MSSPERQTSEPEASAGRILIIDDDADVRRMLRRTLARASYRIEEFAEAIPALERIRTDPPDLVVLDLQLPDRTGNEVLEEIRADPATRLLPVVMLTGYATAAEKGRAASEGVTDFFPKPFSPDELLARIRALLVLKRFADEHEHAERVILTLAKMIDARDHHTAGHSGRVAEYADRIGARMGLDPVLRLETRRGALFHDLGKIVVPDSILLKPGILTPDERKVIEEHPAVGFDLLSPMRTMRKALPVVASHHERLDGSGYPDGLSGDAIPMMVRIVTVSDVFDALTTNRAHRQAMSLETAWEILEEGVRKVWWDGSVLEELRGVIAESGLLGSSQG